MSRRTKAARPIRDRPASKLCHRKQADDGTPKQIELLLDGEGPDRAAGADVKNCGEVRDKEDGEQDTAPQSGKEEKEPHERKNLKQRDAQGTLPVKSR